MGICVAAGLNSGVFANNDVRVAEAADSKTSRVIDSITIANICANNDTGKYGNFSWNKERISVITETQMDIPFVVDDKNAFRIIWTKPNNLPYPSKVRYGYTPTTDSNRDSAAKALDDLTDSDEITQPSYGHLSVAYNNYKEYGKVGPVIEEPIIYGNKSRMVFWIKQKYMASTIQAQSLIFEIKIITTKVQISKGTGIKDVYLSTDKEAKTGSATNTYFDKGATVYAFAKLDKGYKAKYNWTLVSGTADSEDAIYRVASRTMAGEDVYNFGSISPDAKSVYISKDYNYGGYISNLQLTYGQAKEIGSLTRKGYEFKSWNSKADGTGTNYGTAMTASQVNDIILGNVSLSTIYAQWEPTGTVITLNKQGGINGSNEALGIKDSVLENITIPTRSGYTFNGYFEHENGQGTKYYDENGQSDYIWTSEELEAEFYASWTIKPAVQAVIDSINDIGEVSYPGSKTKIDAARSAYTALDAADKGGVSNYSTLVDAETTYNNLMLEGVADVEDAVKAIGTVTLDKEDTIVAARNAYNALTEEQKELFNDDIYDDLVEAELRLAELKDNKEAADVVVAKINAIGEVSYPESKALIDEARAAYNALTNDEQRNFVSNYQTLLDAEEEFEDLKVAGANAANDLIDSIAPVEDTKACKDKIDAAREAYDALTEEQKALIDPNAKETLEANEAEYKNVHDQNEAAAVKALIDDIGTVTYTDESKEKIDLARSAYDALTADQKALIGEAEYKVLTDAEATYEALDDAAKAKEVEDLISAIGTVELTDTCKAKIDAARTAYEALSEDQKELVTNKKVLFDAIELYDTLAHQPKVVDNGVKVEGKDGELIPVNVNVKVEVKTSVKAEEGTTEYQNIQKALGSNQKIAGVYDVKLIRTVGEEQTIIQPSDIKDGMIIIIEITLPDGLSLEGLKVLHIHSADDITYIENYKVENGKLSFETDRLSEIAFVVPHHEGLAGWAIALIAIGGLLLLCGACYALCFFLFNKWIKEEDKAVRVFPFNLGKKDDKARLFAFPCKLVYRKENEIYKTKEEALK